MFKLNLSFLFYILLLPVFPHLACAQDMTKYYTVMHPEEFAIDWTGFYKLNTQATIELRKQYPHHLDLSFGADAKQALDLYLPPGEVSNAPVFVFLHGGGFREGDRAHYGSVALPFIKNGIITAVASYRLTGDGFHYPAQPDDLKNAVKWLYENIESYGGDPGALYVGGHSAGAILAADIGVDRAWMAGMGIPREVIKGIIPISGPYDLRKRGRPGEQYAYAPTAELRIQASPILNINDPVPLALVVCGSKEKYQASSEMFVDGLKDAGVKAHYLLLDGDDHADTANALANENSELSKLILKMILQK